MALNGAHRRPLEGRRRVVVEARGVVIATILVALVLLGVLGLAASSFSPATIRQQACETKQLPASECP
jgi:hypothetical protein